MSKLRLWLAVSVAFGLFATSSPATDTDDPLPEASLEVLLNTIRANRKAFVAINLQLTEDEAEKFWPVYDRYQKDISEVGDQLVALIREYTTQFGTLSNDKAVALVKDHLAIESKRLEIRSAYMNRFAQVLPGRTVARLYQLENKMDAVMRYDLASTIPVIDERADPSAK